MLRLVVFALGFGGLCRVDQLGFKIVLGNSLDVGRVSWKAIRQEPTIVEISQHLPVGQEPGFRCLNHQKNSMVQQPGKIPSVACVKMLNGSSRRYRAFRIDQKNTDFARTTVLNRSLESVKGLLASTAGHNTRTVGRRCELGTVR